MQEQMKIPKIVNQGNRKYKFIKEYKNGVLLYEEITYKYKKCFSKFDLGLVKKIIEPARRRIKPENVKYW